MLKFISCFLAVTSSIQPATCLHIRHLVLRHRPFGSYNTAGISRIRTSSIRCVSSTHTLGKDQKMSRKRTLSKGEEADESPPTKTSSATKKGNDRSTLSRDEIVPRPLADDGKYLKIISWNVNGLNSLVNGKKAILTNLIDSHSPDVFFIQAKI